MVAKAKALRLCKEDFEVLKVIGKGAFGEVAVVRMRGIGEVRSMFGVFMIVLFVSFRVSASLLRDLD